MLQGTRSKWLPFVIASLAVAACVSGLYPLQFFAGSELVASGAFAVAAAIIAGPWVGAVIGAVGGLATFVPWDNFISILPLTFEALAVGLAVRKNRSPMLFGVLYWLGPGLVLVAVPVYGFTDFTIETKNAITLKYIINGVITVMLGGVVAGRLWRLVGERPRVRQTFQAIFRNVIMATIATTATGLTLYWTSTVTSQLTDDLLKSLEYEAATVLTETEIIVDDYVAVVSWAAEMNTLMRGADDWADLLDASRRTHPRALTMLVTDSDGMIIAASPRTMMDGALKEFRSVADRSYFLEPRKTGQPFVSNVFQGRGFGNEPIVAISAPIKRAGEFVGIVEVSLDLRGLEDLDDRTIHTREGLVILDGQQRVAYASEALNLPFLEQLTEGRILDAAAAPADYRALDRTSGAILARRADSARHGLSVIATLPLSELEREVTAYLVRSLVVLTVLMIGGFWVANYIAGRTVAPLRRLAVRLETVRERDQFAALDLGKAGSGIRELEDTETKLNEFAARLREAFALIDKEKAERDALNAALESQVEERTRDLAHALERAEAANVAKSDFLSTMSHEIRTPMNGVLGMLSLVDKTELSEETRERLRIVETSAQSLHVILNDLLDFSKIEAGKLTLEAVPFDLAEVTHDVLALFQADVREKSLFLKVEDDALSVRRVVGDPVRFRQILINLVSNALKFTEHGGVTVSLASDHSESDGDGKACLIVLSVADTGVGIAEDKLAHIFNRFEQEDQTTTRRFGGTGLGLSICRQLATMMHGNIEVHSQLGEGSRFEVRLLLPEAIGDTDLAVETEEVADVSDAAILLVEDHPINRALVQSLLKKKGLEAAVAEDGVQALDYLRQAGPMPNVILCDVQMPNMDGYEAARRIRAGEAGADAKSIPIIALTANAMDEDRARALDAGMTDHVAKPIIEDDLFAAIARALHG